MLTLKIKRKDNTQEVQIDSNRTIGELKAELQKSCTLFVLFRQNTCHSAIAQPDGRWKEVRLRR